MKILQSAAMGFGTLALCAVPLFAGPQSKDAATPKPAPTDQTSRITIQVSGGEGETPVENASIYIKYIEEHKVMKDKKVELNVKTNREGTAHVPDAPMGRVLVQVVADGWKTYGRWYDVNETRQAATLVLRRSKKSLVLPRRVSESKSCENYAGGRQGCLFPDPFDCLRETSGSSSVLHRNSANRVRLLRNV
jgi:hypothetical protein